MYNMYLKTFCILYKCSILIDFLGEFWGRAPFC